MSNFIDNNVSLPANKTDLVPIPAGGSATNYMASNDYNSLSQASQDIRTVIERSVSIMSFGADPTGTSDNSAAFTAAFSAMSNVGVLHLPGINSTTDAYQASGLLLQLLNNESEAFSVGFSGHILPAGASPSIAVNTAVWGVAVNTSVTGGDSAFIYRFETPASGQGAATANTTLLFTVTLANAYSAAGNIVAMCSYGGSGSSVGAGGTPGVSSFYCVVTADNTIQVYPTVTFTPGAATYYYFSFITMGAGATS
jgi:hypothetical protein